MFTTTNPARPGLDALEAEERALVDQLRSTTRPDERAALYRQLAANAHAQAEAWADRPFGDAMATTYQRDADYARCAAELEQQRCIALLRGVDLPDPTIFLDNLCCTPPRDALLALYTAAARGTRIGPLNASS